MKTVALVACMLLLSAGITSADSRNTAKEAIAGLKQGGKAGYNPDELNSIESTFFVAERFRQLNYHELSESYYLLAIQKVRVLIAVKPQRSPATGLSVQLPADNRVPATDAPGTSESARPLEPAEINPQESVKPLETMPAAPKAETVAEGDYLPDEIESDKLVGKPSIYFVAKNETLRLIAAKLGVSRQHLARMNNLNQNAALKVGQKLKYNNRKIIPQRLANGIIINIPDRTLYYFRNGKLAASLPVALGAAKKGAKHDWKTPTGKFTITAKLKDPIWYVPRSIKATMEEEGKEVLTTVPPGRSNPLGKYAIKTSLPGILIHSTTRPGSIYSFASHGCIRVNPENMEQFFKEIRVNTQGEIIYNPVKLAITEEGRIFLEVHQDAYGKSAGLHELANRLIKKRNLADRVDWDKVEAVIAQKAGFAEDITL